MGGPIAPLSDTCSILIQCGVTAFRAIDPS